MIVSVDQAPINREVVFSLLRLVEKLSTPSFQFFVQTYLKYETFVQLQLFVFCFVFLISDLPRKFKLIIFNSSPTKLYKIMRVSFEQPSLNLNLSFWRHWRFQKRELNLLSPLLAPLLGNPLSRKQNYVSFCIFLVFWMYWIHKSASISTCTISQAKQAF